MRICRHGSQDHRQISNEFIVRMSRCSINNRFLNNAVNLTGIVIILLHVTGRFQLKLLLFSLTFPSMRNKISEIFMLQTISWFFSFLFSNFIRRADFPKNIV